MKGKSSHSVAIELRKHIKALVMRLFNNEIFGTYEGIIEVVDADNATVTVNIPELNNLKVKGCRIALPCQSLTSSIRVPFHVGSRVIVTFNSFTLKSPIVIGQIVEPSIVDKVTDDIVIVNGSSSITLKPNGTILLVGADGAITANGEDLTDDDKGTL